MTTRSSVLVSWQTDNSLEEGRTKNYILQEDEQKKKEKGRKFVIKADKQKAQDNP